MEVYVGSSVKHLQTMSLVFGVSATAPTGWVTVLEGHCRGYFWLYYIEVRPKVYVILTLYHGRYINLVLGLFKRTSQLFRTRD